MAGRVIFQWVSIYNVTLACTPHHLVSQSEMLNEEKDVEGPGTGHSLLGDAWVILSTSKEFSYFCFRGNGIIWEPDHSILSF